MGWLRSPGVVYEIVDGQAVVVDPEGTELVTLNAVGTMVWETLDGVREAPELAALLHHQLEGVSRRDLERDITGFLAEIAAAGLVARAGA
jgi:hypothetical protein